MTRNEARTILHEFTDGESLLRHARSVELVMEAYGNKLGEDSEQFAIAGMLHDADYERYPEEHPKIIVQKLRDLGEEELAYAISAHYTLWGNPCKALLDKALLASDELTGFIIAVAQVRPQGIVGMKPKSVTKKLKTASFAATVDRNEVRLGAEALGVDLNEHIAFIIGVLEQHQEELKIGPKAET
ncbi:MAG TPA: metal-dependent phosphohydrolase [Cytophagales bacterium]|nr:metal-dependent phosphohydrolase [Cytophagales bacterium]HAA21153.1 metal-dependent phosphohydrolase [Cytophagales bacterium]HAP60674.1 metal-dependent phosphohydrolase [Cytophagales bacterium]